MNRKILLISCILLTLSLCTFIFYDIDNNKVVIENGDSKQIINTNALTMMYEIEIGSGEYQVSSDTTWPQDGYVFNETLSKCENGSILNWDDENKRVVLSTSVSDKCYVYFDVEPDVIYLADYIKSLYTSDGENDLYYHDGLGSYTNASEEAEDNSYRYSGANPNNYVCFGSNAEDCPDDNLYRIIGVFDGQVKLIKVSSIGYYYWSGLSTSAYNIWADSVLNTNDLNVTFYETINDEWKDKIITNAWFVDGYNTSVVNVKAFYAGENSGITYDSKIGLMYVSDHGYAASPDYWTTDVYYYDSAINFNWLYSGLGEWTITRHSGSSDAAFLIGADGRLDSDYVYNNRNGLYMLSWVRPVFYLKSDVAIEGGTGSMADPYRVY